MPVTKVFFCFVKDGFSQLFIFEVLVLGRRSLADRLSLLRDRGILAGRLGSRFIRGSVAGGPNLLTHGGSWRNGPGALHGDASAAVWDLAMGLGMEKPKAVAGCLLAGYREWTVKGFKGREPKFTTIDPDMERADQLIEDDHAAKFAEVVGRVSHISKNKLDNSDIAWPDHEKLLRCRKVRTAAIVAEMKRRGVEVTEMNAIHLAAILCAAVPTDPAFLLPYHAAFAFEESVEVGGNALPVDSSTEPAAQPCGGMWVGDPKSWPEWKTVHQQTALVKTVADQAEVAFGDHPLYSGDDFGDAEHHFRALRAWMSERPNALFTPPEVVVDAMMRTEGRNREEIVRCSSGRRLSSAPSVKKFATADKPGMRGYLHAMGHTSGVVTSLSDAINWDLDRC